MVFIQFLFASVFTLSSIPPSLFQTFCTAAFPTVGLRPPPSLDTQPVHMLPRLLFDHIRPYGYTSFSVLVVDFVPPHLYDRYGEMVVDEEGPLQAPCEGDILSYAVASIVKEEEERMHDEDGTVDKTSLYRRAADRIDSGALTNRLLFFCPSSRIPAYRVLPSVLPPHNTSDLTEYIVGHLQPHPLLIVLIGLLLLCALVVLVRMYYSERRTMPRSLLLLLLLVLAVVGCCQW